MITHNFKEVTTKKFALWHYYIYTYRKQVWHHTVEEETAYQLVSRISEPSTVWSNNVNHSSCIVPCHDFQDVAALKLQFWNGNRVYRRGLKASVVVGIKIFLGQVLIFGFVNFCTFFIELQNDKWRMVPPAISNQTFLNVEKLCGVSCKTQFGETTVGSDVWSERKPTWQPDMEFEWIRNPWSKWHPCRLLSQSAKSVEEIMGSTTILTSLWFARIIGFISDD